MKNDACASCQGPLINPLCNKCRSKQLAAILTNTGITANDMSHLMRKVPTTTNQTTPENPLFCMICTQELAIICTHCFLKQLRTILELHLPREFSERTLLKLEKQSQEF